MLISSPNIAFGNVDKKEEYRQKVQMARRADSVNLQYTEQCDISLSLTAVRLPFSIRMSRRQALGKFL